MIYRARRADVNEHIILRMRLVALSLAVRIQRKYQLNRPTGVSLPCVFIAEPDIGILAKESDSRPETAVY